MLIGNGGTSQARKGLYMANQPKKGAVHMFGKVIAGAIGSRIAEKSGNSGVLGAAAGLVANRIIRRSPIGAIAVGGAYLAHKLWKHKKMRDEEAAALAAKPVKPVVEAKP